MSDEEIRNLADAIDRYLSWQRFQVELREAQKFRRRLKRQQQSAETPDLFTEEVPA